MVPFAKDLPLTLLLRRHHSYIPFSEGSLLICAALRRLSLRPVSEPSLCHSATDEFSDFHHTPACGPSLMHGACFLSVSFSRPVSSERADCCYKIPSILAICALYHLPPTSMSASQPTNIVAVDSGLRNLWTRLLPYLKSNDQLLPGTPDIEKVRYWSHANLWLTLYILNAAASLAHSTCARDTSNSS